MSSSSSKSSDSDDNTKDWTSASRNTSYQKTLSHSLKKKYKNDVNK